MECAFIAFPAKNHGNDKQTKIYLLFLCVGVAATNTNMQIFIITMAMVKKIF